MCASLQLQVQTGVNLNLNWPIRSLRGQPTYTYIKHQYFGRTCFAILPIIISLHSLHSKQNKPCHCFPPRRKSRNNVSHQPQNNPPPINLPPRQLADQIQSPLIHLPIKQPSNITTNPSLHPRHPLVFRRLLSPCQLPPRHNPQPNNPPLRPPRVRPVPNPHLNIARPQRLPRINLNPRPSLRPRSPACPPLPGWQSREHRTRSPSPRHRRHDRFASPSAARLRVFATDAA